jgi:DNA-binding NarL/FixJ family response regulator
MTTKSTSSLARIENTLALIWKRLESLEKGAAVPAQPRKATLAVQQAVLREKLAKLTVKRHAVLTATLGGVSYQDLAKWMECDETTVKLHLRNALQLLGIENRSVLRASYSKMLDRIPDPEYEARYAVGKRWWLEQKPARMSVLRATKPAKNQHTK